MPFDQSMKLGRAQGLLHPLPAARLHLDPVRQQPLQLGYDLCRVGNGHLGYLDSRV